MLYCRLQRNEGRTEKCCLASTLRVPHEQSRDVCNNYCAQAKLFDCHAVVDPLSGKFALSWVCSKFASVYTPATNVT